MAEVKKKEEPDKPIINGKAEVKKSKGISKFLDVMLYDDIHTIMNRGFKEIIVPKTKDAILSLVALALNGDTSTTYRSSSNGKNSGIPYYDVYGRLKNKQNAPYVAPKTADRTLKNCTRICMYNRKDADDIIEGIRMHFDKAGVVSLGKLYEWCRLDPPHTYYNYGWSTEDEIMRCGYIRRVGPDGEEYILDCPTPKPI